jgi:RNA polymerase sigma-70 factor (ECF subfamily)
VTARRDDLYDEAVRTHGPALDRLARAYEAEPDTRRDLLQEIHFALWRSFETYDARCTMRTWVYRIAHNVAASHVAHDRRTKAKQLVSIETVDVPDARDDAEVLANRHMAIERLLALIRNLKPMDRQVVLLFLEGMDAVGIADVTGISSGNVATKIHRIKNVLAQRFQTGGHHVE